MKKIIGIIIFILLFPAVGVFVYLGHKNQVAEYPLYSGTIESAIRSNLAFEINGRVSDVYADEGDRVVQGTVLAIIDPAIYQTQHRKALSVLDQSAKTLERLEILIEVYNQTLPADVKRATAGVDSAKAVLTEATNNKNRFDGLNQDKVVSKRDWENATLKYETATAQLAEAYAVLEQARSNMKKIDLTQSEIQVAKARYQAAQAAVDLSKIQLDHTRLTAPFDGIVTTRSIEPGEVVSPGKEVLTLSDLKTVELKLFVDEKHIGKVRYEDEAQVTIDTFPDRIYKGKVTFVSPEAEFTPKIIQTHKERVKLVYMVKVSIPNPDVSLKPGMPADARFVNE